MIAAKGRMAAVIFPLLLVAVLYTLVLPHHGDHAIEIRAEFQNVGLLVPGHDVRIEGAKVGSVKKTQLTDHGTVLVTVGLFAGVTPPRADATVSVRPADLVGDAYLALSPGHAPRPLHTIIPTSRTFLATNLQNAFDAFDAPTRTALQSVLVELGHALDSRGIDLNAATLQAAPALQALTTVSDQLSQQTTQLNRLVDNAHAIGSTLAPRTRDIDRLIVGLDATLTHTAVNTRQLDLGLQGLPSTLQQTGATLKQLNQTATTARPLARQLGQIATPLATTVTGAGPFLKRLQTALGQLDPLLTAARKTLKAGRRSLPQLQRTLNTVNEATPSLSSLSGTLTPVLDMGVKGVVGGLGGLAAEPGAEGRNSFRGELVLGCEMFGVPTKPGCLTDLALSLAGTSGSSSAATAPARTLTPAAPKPEPAAAPAAPATQSTPRNPGQSVADAAATATQGTQPVADDVRGLLDYLLKP